MRHRLLPTQGRVDAFKPDTVVLDATLDPTLENAVLALSADHRRVVELVDVDGLTYEEAAEVLEVPLGTVMSRLHRARGKLREALRGTHLDRAAAAKAVAEDAEEVARLTWTAEASGLKVAQGTPVRVLHRRSSAVREKFVLSCEADVVPGTYGHAFVLRLTTGAGTYVKEFVHGDLGRTHPSVASLLGRAAWCLQLDVLGVSMEYMSRLNALIIIR